MRKVKPSKNEPVAGTRFGKLVVIMRVHDNNKTDSANLKVRVRVQCDCGQRLTIPYYYLVRTHATPKTHCGKCGPKSLSTLHEYTHRSWYMMNYRCTQPTHVAYKDYGGRGIQVDPRWSWVNEDGFKNFLEDMGERPKGKTLDREDNQGHYTRDNCRWATAVEQRNNQGRVGDLAIPSWNKAEEPAATTEQQLPLTPEDVEGIANVE